jgi:hypothetical protein
MMTCRRLLQQDVRKRERGPMNPSQNLTVASRVLAGLEFATCYGGTLHRPSYCRAFIWFDLV